MIIDVNGNDLSWLRQCMSRGGVETKVSYQHLHINSSYRRDFSELSVYFLRSYEAAI
jgi:hypothetical protein